MTEREAGKRLRSPNAPQTRLGVRDRAILGLLVACGLCRDELARLEVGEVQVRDEHWVLLNLEEKGDESGLFPSRSG